MELRIGISGWTYAPWRGVFFPADLPQKQELAYASGKVNSIEINSTFYSLQKPLTYASWASQVPEDFVFSVKAPRFITHIRRLQGCQLPVANFFASGVLRLGPRLGPILWQLPPSLPYRREPLERFLGLLPRDTTEASALARRHDTHLRAKAWLDGGPKHPLRHALEVRHSSFETKEFIRLLKDHDIACAVADTAGRWPLIESPTSDFMYLRLHGDEELYASGYTPRALGRWAAKIKAWNRRRAVFVYFDNDIKVHAPYDARMLAHRLGSGPTPTSPEREHRTCTRARAPVRNGPPNDV